MIGHDDLLTADEHQAMHVSADLANLLARIIGAGPSRDGDWAEVAAAIHVVQNMILSQAAARAYPNLYRLMGQPQILGCTHAPDTTDLPDTGNYIELELFVSGAISTLPEFASRHPACCLPIARRALEALAEWEPTDALDVSTADTATAKRHPYSEGTSSRACTFPGCTDVYDLDGTHYDVPAADTSIEDTP